MALIRQALGTIREPISQEALGELVGFDKYKISRIERGAQELSRADAIAIAAVDPKRRGPAWLMFGDEDEGGQGAPRPTTTPVTPAPANSRRAHVPLTETEVLETRYLRPKKKQTPKRRPGDKSAMA